MREYNILQGYPSPKVPRYVSSGLRTIENRIIASCRDKRYYDGDRDCGYGGYTYDGRWKTIAGAMCIEYGLTEHSAVLQLGCEKGFLLHDFYEKYPAMKLRGVEVSDYAIEMAMPTIKDCIFKNSFTELPFQDNEFDFVIAIGVVYCLSLVDVLQCLREIQRVGKGHSFITLGAYRNDNDRRLFEYWTLLGTTILHVDEWCAVLNAVGYTGDYHFTTAATLQLIEKV